MASVTIEAFSSAYRQWAEDFITKEWGSLWMVTRGRLFHVLDYPGFVALVDEHPQGILTYHITESQCEVLILHSAVEGFGIGSALIDHAKEAAREAGCKRLWLITTNDNIHAIGWYQKRGFTITAVHVNALAESRKLKPEIPLIGADGIPLRDEIEFEILL